MMDEVLVLLRCYLGFEGDLWGRQGIIADEVDVHGERPSGVGAAIRAVDDQLPVEDVRHRRGAGTAEVRRVNPQGFELFLDPFSRWLRAHHHPSRSYQE